MYIYAPPKISAKPMKNNDYLRYIKSFYAKRRLYYASKPH